MANTFCAQCKKWYHKDGTVAPGPEDEPTVIIEPKVKDSKLNRIVE